MVSDDIDIEELVELAIDMPDIVLDGGIDMAIEPVELIVDISMTSLVCKISEFTKVLFKCFVSTTLTRDSYCVLYYFVCKDA